MAVVLYSPSLAIQQVTGIPLWVSIFVTGFVCTIYTSLGGMKAVVITDTFQVFVMFAGKLNKTSIFSKWNNLIFFQLGLLAIIIEGARRVGGMNVVFDRMAVGNRLEFFE